MPADCTLRETAAQSGFFIGAAVDPAELQNDPDYGPLLAREFNSLTPENHMKWGVLSQAPGQYDFAAADAMVAFAEANGMRVRGHTLVWDMQLPSYVEDVSTEQEMRALLQDHISRVAGRYADLAPSLARGATGRANELTDLITQLLAGTAHDSSTPSCSSRRS